ncbi:MAG: FAD-dependent monooxygenase [Cyanothece sp. SIO1E1]|nr:FAD-dependent monooxygenase [Cyanothece sp. SIO1E1]
MTTKIVIVGAGPCGILLAHYLLHRCDQYQVDIYDRRSDPRCIPFTKCRTYPLALNQRGFEALQRVEGLVDAVKAEGVEIKGSVSHLQTGKKKVLPRHKPLITIDRTRLVIALLEKLTHHYDSDRLRLHFNHKCVEVDMEAKTITFQYVTDSQIQREEDVLTLPYDLLFGVDGVRSTIRTQLINTERFEFEQKYVQQDYKTVFFPCPSTRNEISLEPDHIHAWRLKDGTGLLAVPQPDQSLSGVIIFPRDQGKVADLSTPTEVLSFFYQNFQEIGQLMPESEAEAFLKRPISTVLTIRCSHYHYGDSVLIMGDAAHAVSPALGQGCNSAFEDVVVLDRILDQYAGDFAMAIPQFTTQRTPDAHALLELSEGPFPLSKGLFIEFMVRLHWARLMHKLFPKRYPPFVTDLISDTTVPYSEILQFYRGWMSKVKRSNRRYLEAIAADGGDR